MSEDGARAPRVYRDSWGELDVEGVGTLRDAKLWPGGGGAWDWTETGTHHRPGIQPADVLELLDHDVEVVVLSRGRDLQLETCPETLVLLQTCGVQVVRDETSAAIAAYNRLAAQGRRVAALLHSTC